MRILQLSGLPRARMFRRPLSPPWSRHNTSSPGLSTGCRSSRVLREPLHRPDCGPADSVSVISAPGVRRDTHKVRHELPERPPTRAGGPVGRVRNRPANQKGVWFSCHAA
jgi:hypothetical protein